MTTPYRQLQIRRGLKGDLPVLADGEPAFCEDTGELFIGTPDGNVLLGYLAMSPSNWVSPQPKTLSEGMDRIAAYVVAQLGGQIP